MDYDALNAYIHDAVARGDAAMISECCILFDDASAKTTDPSFPATTFDLLISLMNDDCFRSLKGSWEILKIFDDNWEMLVPQQRRLLLDEMVGNFDKFSDWMTPFLFSEMIGTYCCDEMGLDALCRIRSTASEKSRQFIPHGLSHIAQQAENTAVAIRALAVLEEMARDPSEVVRSEVKDWLRASQSKRPGED